MTAASKRALFYENIQALNKEVHANYGLKEIKNPFSFAANANAVPITIRELSAVTISYPIVFVGEDKLPAAALAFSEGTNLFVNPDGTWVPNMYIPAGVQRYPFLMAKSPNSDEMYFCFDQNAEQVASENPDIALFDGDDLSEFAVNIMKNCERFEQELLMTKSAIQKLEEFELFCIKTVNFKPQKDSPDQKIQFTALDEKKIRQLSDDAVAELHKSGLLDFIYAHLFSLANWNRLINRYNELNQ